MLICKMKQMYFNVKNVIIKDHITNGFTSSFLQEFSGYQIVYIMASQNYKIIFIKIGQAPLLTDRRQGSWLS